MSGQGRPLRFLGLVTLGWIGLRVVMLWPDAESLGAAVRGAMPLPRLARVEPRPRPAAAVVRVPRLATAARHVRMADPIEVQLALLGLIRYGEAVPVAPEGQVAMLDIPWRPDAASAAMARRSPWSGSAWIVARGGSGLASAPGGQLGGGQGGLRIAYRLRSASGLAAVARLTSPLHGPGREAALGMEWQPGRLPVRIVAEHRFGLDGGSGGPGIGAIAGGSLAIPGGFDLEGYGQAGAIKRGHVELYADGAARALRPVAQLAGVRIALGAGVWGAAQRGAQRLDLGPAASASLALEGRTLRLLADWRERIAGAARPGSGPAITLATDF